MASADVRGVVLDLVEDLGGTRCASAASLDVRPRPLAARVDRVAAAAAGEDAIARSSDSADHQRMRCCSLVPVRSWTWPRT